MRSAGCNRKDRKEHKEPNEMACIAFSEFFVVKHWSSQPVACPSVGWSVTNHRYDLLTLPPVALLHLPVEGR